MTHALSLGQMTIEPFSKFEQIGHAKSSASRRGLHESVRWQHIGQIGRKRVLRPVTVEIEHPVRAPCMTTLEELVAGPAERMEGMRYSEPATLILGIGCS
jgi:hypothetical protein